MALSIPILGVVCNIDKHTLTRKVKQVTNRNELLRKRMVLALAHRMFDIKSYMAWKMIIPKNDFSGILKFKK